MDGRPLKKYIDKKVDQKGRRQTGVIQRSFRVKRKLVRFGVALWRNYELHRQWKPRLKGRLSSGGTLDQGNRRDLSIKGKNRRISEDNRRKRKDDKEDFVKRPEVIITTGLSQTPDGGKIQRHPMLKETPYRSNGI